MSTHEHKPGVAIITGAAGQDGYFLTERLVNEGWLVHATARRADLLKLDHLPAEARSRLHPHEIDLLNPQPLFDLIVRTQPDEFYNLGGQSSVSKSFSDPLYTWRTNAEAVVHLLECLRQDSSHTRFYQASSTDMFGVNPAGATVHNEDSVLNPQSPYASAKAAAHLLCHSYREAYGLRIASGILSNHESHRRPASFISRKVVDHVLSLSGMGIEELKRAAPLAMGNLKARRDWGFAPDYADGMVRILRQIEVRAEQRTTSAQADQGHNYRDYVLGTGQTHAVWELADCAFRIAGLDLEWHLENDDASAWRADFRTTGSPAVVVDASLLRVAEPTVIQVDPARARKELGWAPRAGLEVFLEDMITKLSVAGLSSHNRP
jgi:GDPmannose 4,6-dehydratase